MFIQVLCRVHLQGVGSRVWSPWGCTWDLTWKTFSVTVMDMVEVLMPKTPPCQSIQDNLNSEAIPYFKGGFPELGFPL